MRRSAVIVAGGSGTRMGAGIPKQFIELFGKPIFLYSLETFLQAFEDIHIVLVLPEMHKQQALEMLTKFHFPLERINVVSGGETRFHSVKNGLACVEDGSIVFVHDAVRCLLSKELIQRCYDACLNHGSAIPSIPVRDSIRQVTDNGQSSIVDRNALRIVQTPQTFFASDLKQAFRSAYQESFTDEASVMEHMGKNIHLIPGEESNLKITFPEDISYASWKLASNQLN